MDLFDIYSSLITWFSTISFSEVVSKFWFLFYIEIPRFYILDVGVLIWFGLTKNHRKLRHELARIRLQRENPFISIIVPGKNEGEHIYKLVVSLREQTFQNFELIIIDDGSDDNTDIICTALEQEKFITKFHRAQVRGGKASAANLGLLNVRSQYIVHLDADSSLDRDAIEEILIPFFDNSKVRAVGGCVKVRNNKASICTSLQAIEYLEAIMVGRTVSSALGIYRIISGAFGAFEINTLRQVGGWDIGPGLDGDITQKIRKTGYKVVFAPRAICLTNAPVKFRALFKQRLRWSKSLIRFRIRKHANVLDFRSMNFNILNFLSNMENILFNFVFDILWLGYLINLIISNQGILTELVLMKFCITLFLSIFSFLVAMLFTERPKDEMFLYKYIPLRSFYMGYFLRINRILGTFKELFFFSSYKDSWNPRKTSIYAESDKT